MSTEICRDCTWWCVCEQVSENWALCAVGNGIPRDTDFWKKQKFGECRVEPPVVMPSHSSPGYPQFDTKFPLTTEGCFCGKFKARPVYTPVQMHEVAST